MDIPSFSYRVQLTFKAHNLLLIAHYLLLIAHNLLLKKQSPDPFAFFYSTVTDFAKLRGLSTSQPLCRAA